MAVITMCFAVLGFLSPANRGGLMTAMLLLFVFMGVPAGYASAFLHKTLKGADWRKNILLTATFFPVSLEKKRLSPGNFPRHPQILGPDNKKTVTKHIAFLRHPAFISKNILLTATG